MTSNYKEVYKIKDRLWSTECPVLLESAGLFKDSKTNAVIALCEFRNITLKKLKAVFLSLTCFGIDGAILNDDVDFIYLDLSVPCNDVFGKSNPILISNATIRKIDIIVKKVVFDDNYIWENTDAIRLQPVLSTNPASSLGELKEVYQWKTGFFVLPVEQSDYWICGCNILNPSRNQNCINCKSEKKWVFAQVERQYLENALPEYKQHIEVGKKKRVKIFATAMTLMIVIVGIFAGITILNTESPELKLAKEMADELIRYDVLAKGTYQMAQSCQGKDDEQYKKLMESYNYWRNEKEKLKVEAAEIYSKLNSKEREEADRYVNQRIAETYNI